MIDVTVRQPRRSIDAWIALLTDPTPGMDQARIAVEDAVRASIESRRDPRGRPWRPLTPTTIELRRRGIGGSTGSTLAGISSRTEPRGRRAVIYVSAPGPREVVQQRGISRGRLKIFGRPSRKEVPARPFMPEPGAAPPRLMTAIKRGLLAGLREALRTRTSR